MTRGARHARQRGHRAVDGSRRHAPIEFASEPDGNTVKIQFIRPESTDRPAVRVLHPRRRHGRRCRASTACTGRGAGSSPHQGVAVAMVDFRNCARRLVGTRGGAVPGRAQRLRGRAEVGRRARRRARHRRRPHRSSPARAAAATSRSPPGSSSKRDGDIGLIRGLYALCPYIAGEWPQDRFPSSIENNGILHRSPQQPRSRSATASRSSMPATRSRGRRSPTEDDVAGLPPTVISVNECDPLRDEGIEFYRLLLRAGVPARCRQMMGTIHGTEIFSVACPDVSRETAGEHRPVLPRRLNAVTRPDFVRRRCSRRAVRESHGDFERSLRPRRCHPRV